MIICCGEALIDMLPRQLTGGEDVFLPAAGGAIFNTAIALGRLGEDTGFVSGISNDMFGKQLTETLRQSNVSTRFCMHSDYPSTLAFVKLTNGNAEYSFFDENSAGRMISVEDLPKFSDDVSALHFGAISLIPEPCGSVYETLLTNEAPHRVISLDPNIRESFITDEDTHRGRIERMCALSDIIKVSDEDLAWIANGKSDEQTIKSWLSGNTSIVVMTKGSEGVDIYTKNFTTSVDAVHATVVDTVGAGDTFNAGFLSGLKEAGKLSKAGLSDIDEASVKSAAQLAAKVASITVSRSGANPPWRDEL